MKLFTILSLLIALPALAEEAPKPVAICSASGVFGHYLKVEFFYSNVPGADSDARVTVQDEHGQRVATVKADFRIKTWNTYGAIFDAFGRNYVLEFSNFESPSLGEMNVNRGPTEPIVCLLKFEV